MLDKGLRGLKRPASVVIDSVTYLLTISLPDINNIAMSLYDIIANDVIGHVVTSHASAPCVACTL